MGALRDQMETYLKLKGRSPATIDTYLRGARAFAAFHMKPPSEMGEPEVRAFLVHLTDERKLAARSLATYIAALKVLYRDVLGRPEVVAWVPWPKKPKTLPTILTPGEVAQLLVAADSARTQAMIMTGYGAGLRMSEVRHLRPGDIDSKRGVLWVRLGKGRKDRLAPLPPRLLRQLRDYWRLTRPVGPWLFPGQDPAKPLSKNGANRQFRRAVALSGITRPIRFHNLRASFATHLMEGGTDLPTIQALLGHARLNTSMVYLRVRAEHLKSVQSPLEGLDFPDGSPLK